jgi:tape measure domain-containing protein
LANKKLKVDVIVNAKTRQVDRMFKKLNNIQTQINKQASAQHKVTKAVDKTNRSYKKSATLINGMTKALRHLAGGYLAVQAAKAAITSSDTITNAENKLNAQNGNDKIATQDAMDKMYAAAQRSRTGYDDMMKNVSKSMTLAPEAFGDNIDNAIRFQEIMGKTYALGGASAAEQSSSMYQLIQSLGAGKLQGDELRSMTEGAPLAAKVIEKYAQELYKTDAALKDMGSDGLITSEIVVAAMMNMGSEVDRQFKDMSTTFEQAWTMMKNTALKSFEPVLKKMNDLLNSPVGESIVNDIGKAIQIVAGILMIVFNTIESIYNFITENWEIISDILWTAVAIIGGVLLGKLILNFAAVVALITKYIVLGVQAVASGIAAAAAWAVTHWQMLLIIAVIAAIVIAIIWMADSFADACGIIVGLWYGTGAAIQTIWENVKQAFSNILNRMKGEFWDFVATVLKDCEPLLNAINKILGAFGKQTISVEWAMNKANGYKALEDYNYKSVSDAYHNAYDKGYGIGVQWANDMKDKASGVKDKISGALNLGLPNDGIAPNLEEIAGNTGGINDNTGKMADSMQLTAEDLAYLRDVANMEWKKEFTTANIQVDMTNNNTVDKDFDLNSLAIGLRNLVEEEMFAVANGVYV